MSKSTKGLIWVFSLGMLWVVSNWIYDGAQSNTRFSSTPTKETYPPAIPNLRGAVLLTMPKVAKDPDSVEYMDWGSVVERGNGIYSIWVKYRARNSFGAFTIEEQTFVYRVSRNGDMTFVGVE